MKNFIKVLIIGDSNCMPRLSKSKKENLPPEKIYTHMLRNKYKDFLFKEVVWGGVKTSMLIDYSVNYYKRWQPDFIIVHTGVNDIKTQLLSEKTSYKIFKITNFLKLDKKKIKEKILYNPKYIKYLNTNKVSPLNLSIEAKKLIKNFKKSKIIWIGIHSNRKINQERPHTYEAISKYNKEIKKYFNSNFIDNDLTNSSFTKDGYHLNHLGHKTLFKKVSYFFNKKNNI